MSTETTAASTAPHWLRGRFARRVFATDHKQIGVIWLGVGGLGLFLGGLLALVTALQTARTDATVIGEGTFASLATMQGTLLTYGGILPLALGLAVVLVPLQIGARGLALPELSAVGVWLGGAGVVTVILSSFAPGDAPRSSWTTLPPLALAAERPGESVRLMGLVLIGLGALLTAIALVATLRGDRVPGMTNDRLPLFTQSAGIFAAALLLLAPWSLFANLLLLLARANPGSFDWYVTEEGGLLRGYGWLFGQGLVAIALVPALGVAAEIVATFLRADLASRRLVTAGLAATAVLVVLVPSADTVDAHRWAAALAVVAAVPLGLAAGALLLAGLRAARANPHTTPLPFALGALLLVLASLLASVVLVLRHDELTGTTFASARLELLWSAALIALLGGVVYWWPKLFGRLLDARLTSLSAIVLTVSALLLAVGHGAAGWSGQASHTGVTIDDAGTASLVAALGVPGLALGLLLFGLAKLKAAKGRRVGNDPWEGDTLEWVTASPPPPGNFGSVPPVTSARPLDDLRRSLREQGAL